MTIESEINRIKQNIADCYTTLTAKGATIPAVENVANLAACIRTIPTTPPAFETQSGDTIVTSAGTPLAIDGISSLTTAPSITDGLLTFADDGNDTVSFSMQQLKDYVNPAPAGQSRFVVASAAKFAYSDDGLSWTEVNNTSTASQIAFGNGKFVAIKYNSANYSYSTDGITWTDSTLPSSQTWSGIAFGNGIFIISRSGSDRYLYSTDGITWTEYNTSSVSYSNNLISYCNDKFIMTLNGSSAFFIYSTDGINWSTGNFGMADEWRGVVYGNGIYVAYSGNSHTRYSTDLTQWFDSYSPSSEYWYKGAYGNGKFVIISGAGDSAFCYGSDGETWTAGVFPVGNMPTWDIIFANNIFIAIASETTTYFYSSDGITWSTGTLPSSQWWNRIAYGEITPPPTPSGTTLHQYDRVDGKATVADFWTDGNGQRYAVCVADAQYRSGSGMTWGDFNTDTTLPNYSSSSTALAAGESGTSNTDTILNNYSSTDYGAFDFARNACTVTIDGQNFESCLPNLKELQILYNDRATLDTYDTTLSSYSARSLSTFKFGANGAWSSTESSDTGGTYVWCFAVNSKTGLADIDDFSKQFYDMYFGVCPIIEIPVDENGTVITN